MGTESLETGFRQHYHSASTVFSAPGRVNLIGEHTDYNDGFVLPAAINFHTWVAIAPRTDRRLEIRSASQSEAATLDLDAPAPPVKKWSDYVFGVAVALEQSGLRLKGANLYIEGDVPLGAGLSSSASLEVATALALTTVAGHALERTDLALLCQRAENEYVGMRCGIMDQFVVAHGQADRALLLDCRSLDFRTLPLMPGTRLVICNTGVHHQLAGSEYNVRRQQCEAGAAALHVKALRDVTVSDLQTSAGDMSEVVFRRCRHVVSENARVQEAADALEKQDAAAFGKLMWASHRSLKDDYEVSCPELDVLVEVAMGVPGVWGSRMTGGGFGGCTVNLVQADAVDVFRDTILKQYREATGRTAEVYVSTAVEGARAVPPA